jgi:UDP-N-acetylglucosamine diphosphorylase/glucosamine-1-phosphate N-acetyltransferase
VAVIQSLKQNEALRYDNNIIACKADATLAHEVVANGWEHKRIKIIDYQNEVLVIDRLWKIFANNGAQIIEDFPIITKNRNSHPINDPHTIVYAPENIFIEEGVSIKAAVINAEGGPVYIGKNANIQEGSMIQGPFGMHEGAILNMGAKIRPNTTIGPYSKVGGEVNNAVIIGYSNKGHEGFLGNSVLGEWCNLGADTNSSNLKNNYSSVELWSYAEKDYVSTGLQFCGLIMGDHSKCAINTMFNTGTVVGVAANIFGAGFPPKFIPSFVWDPIVQKAEYRINKVLEVAEKAMQRRDQDLSDVDKSILEKVFEITEEYRNIK